MKLERITPDKEKAKSILRMILLINERIKIQNKTKMAALVISDYYEIMKELITAILLVDGYKTLSHKELIEYIDKNYQEFSSHEIFIMDSLRVLRNRVVYEGFFVDSSYLNRNESNFKKIIKKLRNLLVKNLKI